MPWGIAAAVAAPLVSAGIGAITSSGQSAAIGQGQAQSNAAEQQAIATGQTNYNTATSNFKPFVSAGTTGLNGLADASGANGPTGNANALANFQASPGYQYQVQQGLRAVDNGAASQGLLRSGATLKAEQTLGSDLANQDFGQYVGRLNTLAGYGVQGAQGVNTATGSFNSLLGTATTGIASTDTSAAGANASIYGNAGNTFGNAAGTGINNLLNPTVAPIQPYTVQSPSVTPIYDSINYG